MAHCSKEYMRDFRARQKEKAAQKNGQLSDAYDILGTDFTEEFIEERMNHGYTREQCEEYLRNYGMPPETQKVNAATDSVPECFGRQEPDCSDIGDCPSYNACLEAWKARQEAGGDQRKTEIKPDCFGTKQFTFDCDCSLELDCNKAWNVESAKPQTQKDRERRDKIMKFLADSKALARQSEIRDLKALADSLIVIEKKKQTELDALTKKYTDRGIPEKTALESATWEQKQIQNAEMRRRMVAQDKWDLMTKEEQTAYKMKVVEDSKKLLEGSTSDNARVPVSYPRDYSTPEKRTRGDEYGRPRTNFETVGSTFGKDPDEYGKSDAEIRDLREKKRKERGHE